MQELFTEKPSSISEEKHAENILEKFARKAFRTEPPIDPLYLKRLLLHFRANRENGMEFKEAILFPMTLILTSPEFLYLKESEDSRSVSAHELAVRLSYFLWSSPPDEELLSLAENGTIKEPQVLEQQLERMIKDPRFDQCIEGFCYQWLGMSRLGLFPFDTTKHPGFDNAVMDSARREIFNSVKYVLTEKLPVRDLLGANYIIINDVMADHYGIHGVVGHEFKKVSMPHNSYRGGLLGTTAVLAMGSDGVHSSLVERGVWVLEHLLDMAPPPAPPNVPQLDRLKTGFLSARELAHMHQDAPQCAHA